MAPINPAKVSGAGRKELPTYLANGVVGLRVRDNPLMAGMALLCGYSGLHPARKIEAAAVAPYPLGADIALDGVWMSDVPHRITVLDQAYDFSCGELTSRLRFSANGTTADITVLTFCCRHQPTLVVQEISMRLDRHCQLKVQAQVDTRQIGGKLEARTSQTPGKDVQDFDGSLCWQAEGGYSRCGIALVSRFAPEAERQEPTGNRTRLCTQYGLKARAGKTYRLLQIASLVPSAIHNQPDRQAERMVCLGAHYGMAALRHANRAEWRELWKGRIVLDGAERHWQQLADAAFFYMNCSVHASSPASTSMFGLATWHDYHYYYGHVMWDIETFSLPSLTLLQPEAARALLEYRLRGLASARTNAQCFGRRGLQFPWESAPSSAQEATPSPGTPCWHEDHVSLDVALAFHLYANLTGDENFRATNVWPVLHGVSEWVVSRSHRTRHGYEIRRSMGIAERKKETDNDAFTALSAKAVLEAALWTANHIGMHPGTDWEAVARGLVVPKRDGRLIPHDGFRENEEKAATPSPLMGIFPLESALDPAIARATTDYYLRRAEEYIGSPMLSSLYGVWAARYGDRRKSLELLEKGYAQFASGRFCQTLEYHPEKFPEQPQAGPFFANMGGFLMSLLLGFPRLRPGPGDVSGWGKQDVILPAGWKQIAVERIWLKGRPARLCAAHGRPAAVTFLD